MYTRSRDTPQSDLTRVQQAASICRERFVNVHMCKTDSQCVVGARADLLHMGAHHQTGCHAEPKNKPKPEVMLSDV